MGKLMRSVAVVHDFTTQPVLKGIKRTGLFVKDTASYARTTFKEELANVEDKRSAKAEMASAVEEVKAKVTTARKTADTKA